MQPVMSGQAAVGVLVSLIQVFSAGAGIHTSDASGGSDVGGEEASAARAAFVFFGLSTLFLVFSTASHIWLETLTAYKAVVAPFQAKAGVIGVDEEREALVGGGGMADRLRHKKGRIWAVAKMNAEYNFAAAYVFMVTLSVFPPITSSIRSVHPPSSSALTHPLLFTAIHFLTFNIGDFIGRYLPMVPRLQIWSSRSHVYMALARTLFVPLFLLCNVRRPSSLGMPAAGGPVINSDIMFFLILLFFGMSNGYIGSLVMMAAPSREHNPRLKYRPEDVDTAAIIAQFCLVGGLAIGSFMSFGVRGAICACNPFIT
jgi:solute carrier family 29 (equilibrative nucleoside transporter), member 1/2/3